jgi:TolB-like protein/tetratricopeptide (TPR) repeat protein
MDEPSSGIHTPASAPEQRLDSWKEIAVYLNRDVTTVQRWERREGMPVHRHQHDKRGSVYALSSELDAWVRSRIPSPLEEIQGEEIEEPAIQAPEEARADTGPNKGWNIRRRRILVGSVAALLILLAAGYVAARIWRAKASPPKVKSLAVLPLKNLSGDPSQEYLADGMTEELIGRLAGIRELRVVSRTSSMHFKDTQLSIPEICRQLSVDAVVEGSVIRQGNRIRVHAQLIRGATDEHFWSETYDREVQDVLALQADVAQSIAQKVEVTVTGEEQARLAAVRSVPPDVYENYLRGRFALDKDNTPADVQDSIAYFEKAIQQDPTFPPAYVGLAGAYFEQSTVFIGVSPDATRPKAMTAIRKALELDPESVEAHLLLADMLQLQWHWGEAEAEYRRALELKPNDAAAHVGVAHWLLDQGRVDEAFAYATRARELDPLAASGTDIGWILFCAHRYDEAIHEWRSIAAVRPDDAGILWYLGFALIANNQPGEAVPLLEKALSASNRSPGVMGVLVRAYAHAGRRADALRLLGELKERKRAGYVPAAAFVNAYLGLGDNDQALVWLEQAYQEHSNILLFLKVHPYFDPLRNDPRFASLLHRVGLG